MSLDEDIINQQIALLVTHRRTLAHLLQQAAQFGGAVFAPPQTANGIAEARQQIQRIKAALREGSVQVEDEPNDDALPAAVATPAGEPAATGPRVQSTISVTENKGTVIGTNIGTQTINQPNWAVTGNVTNVAGDQRTINTQGGDYAEGDIISGDKVIGDKVLGDKAINTGGGDYIDKQIIQPSLAPALHQLRAPVGDFVGRTAEIDQLVKALTRGGGAAISGVRGMGGIGKTELAYAAAQRLAEQFPDAQLLVELRGASDNPLSPAQALQIAIRAFEREAKLPDDVGELRNIYCSVLAGKKALIFADDAKDAAQVRPLLPPHGCALLVTSRHRFSLPGMGVLDLGTLPPEDAATLLLEICPRIDEHALKLAKLCGYLPLALRVSAGVLETNDTREVARYLAQLELERLKYLRDPDDPQASVEASLRLSYDALELTVQRALGQLSVFPPSFDGAAAQAVVAIEGDVVVALELLRRRSLLDWDANLQRYSLHDLVRAFAAARLEAADTVQLRHARYYAQVADRANNLYLEGGMVTLSGLALFDQERIHIDAGWGWALAHAGEQDADALLLDYADATAYVGDLRYDKQRERIPLLEATLAAAQRLKSREEEGAALGNLGLAYADLGDARKAITFYEQDLALARELGDRPGEGAALANLGIAYYSLGDARKAISFYEQHLALAREIGDRPGEGATLGNLGIAYNSLGDARKAISFYEQHLALARELGDRRGEGNVLGNLGNAYNSLGDARKAISFYEQHLALARELGDRRGEGNVLGNLGIAYYSLGDARKAISFYEQHLALARELGDRRGEAMASWNLGLALETEGHLAQAVTAMKVCVDFEQEIVHPHAEKHNTKLEQVRQRLAGGEDGTVAGEGAQQ